MKFNLTYRRVITGSCQISCDNDEVARLLVDILESGDHQEEIENALKDDTGSGEADVEVQYLYGDR